MWRTTLFAFLFTASASAAVVTTVAGVPAVPGYRDGTASDALFTHPTWLDVVVGTTGPSSCDEGDTGEIYVIDRINQQIRRIADDAVTTIPATGLNFGSAFGGGILVEPPGSGCGCGPYARGVFVSSSGTRQVVLLAMNGAPGNRDELVTLNSGSGSMPTALARSRAYGNDFGTLAAARSLYVVDASNDVVLRSGFGLSFEACPQPGGFFALAGESGHPGWSDGKGAGAHFNTPRGIAVAPDGGLYVTDSGNHTIRRIAPDGTVTTVAGQAGTPGSNDGPALQAHFNTPSGIDVDKDGNVFIVDTFNHTIRELTKDGNVITVAGRPGVSGFADGDAKSALFNAPVGLKIAPDGSLVVADTGNNCIRRVSLK